MAVYVIACSDNFNELDYSLKFGTCFDNYRSCQQKFPGSFFWILHQNSNPKQSKSAQDYFLP